jgi:hypothetical protein
LSHIVHQRLWTEVQVAGAMGYALTKLTQLTLYPARDVTETEHHARGRAGD